MILPPLNKAMRCGLLCNSDGKILLIHDGILSQEIDYLNYDEASNTLSIVYIDGQMQESGLNISADISRNLRSGTEIQTALLKNQSIMELGKVIFVVSSI